MNLKKRVAHVLFCCSILPFVAVSAAQNLSPFVFSGPDQALAAPGSEVTLTGFVSDPDGVAESYAWSKVSGGAATIVSPTLGTTTVTGLAVGTYVFRLTGSDGQGGSASDDVQVIVHPVAGKTVTLTPSGPGQIYRLNLASYNILPGDTIVIPAGSYPLGIEIGGFAGSATNPVKIINGGGLVQAKLIGISNAQYFKLSGSGSSDTYGFKIGGNINSTGVAIGRATSDYEVERIEVEISSVGLFCKIQPVAADPLTQHPGWFINNVYLHDNYIHQTENEGMYIGHTFPNGHESTNYLIPVRMQNVKIYNNIIASAGWDAMQLSNAREGGEIFNNTVTNYGTKGVGSQQAGIQLGGNTTGRVYANTIHTGTGPSLTAYGYGDVYLSRNTVTKGGTGDKQDVVYTSGGVNSIETNPGLAMHILNNRIIEPTNAAIRNSNNNHNQLPGEIRLNTILDPTGRTLTQLILSYAGDTISGNTLFMGNPIVTIQSHTETSFTTSSSTLSLSGVAADDGGVTSVTWENAMTGGGGPAGGTPTNWSISGVALLPGLNRITVAAHDADGNTGTAVVTVTYIPVAGGLLAAYNAGDLVNFFNSVDDAGVTYQKDPNIGPIVSGGTATTLNPSVSIANTQDDTIFQTYRWGNHSWSISGLASGEYQIRLRFAANSSDKEGDRVFNIAVEGVPVRSNFDIRTNPPVAVNTARDEIINAVVTDGTLNIQFTGVSGSAKINGIEVRTALSAGLTSAGLTGAGVGSGSTGSSAVLPSGKWEVSESGGTLGGISEAGWFEKLSQSGNFRAVVRVEGLTGSANTRAGLMVRDGSGAGARMVFIGTSLGTNYILASRAVANQAASVAQDAANYAYPSAWLMLARQGDEITLASSADGVDFTTLSSATLASLGGSVDLGLFMTGGGSPAAKAVFSGFDVSPLAIIAYDCGKTSGGATISLDDGITKYLQDPNALPIVNGGNAATITPAVAIADTEDDLLFQSYHYGTHSWNIPNLPSGTYTVTFRFVANSGDTLTSRVFDVAMEGETVLPGFNIRQVAGGINKAIDVPIDILVNDGTLNILFTTVAGNAKVNAIKVVPKQ